MKYKILELLKETPDYISGETIAKQLNVSRMAISKNIASLKSLGYNIESSTKKGYLLKESFDILNEFEIKHNLSTSKFGCNCIYFDVIDSTNIYAKKIAETSEEGTVIVAENQTGGHGRRGKQWTSSSDGAWFSFILKPNASPDVVPVITLIAGLAVCKALGQFDPLIKWPNDVIINGKKLVGISAEMNAEVDYVKYIIVGIGVNVNSTAFFGELKEKATSLRIETDKTFERSQIISILINFENLYNKFCENFSFEPFLDEYKRKCITLNKRLKLIYNNDEITGECLDIDKNGNLIIKKDNSNEIISVFAGEISVRLENGNYI